MDRSPCYVTIQIHDGTVAHQFFGRHNKIVYKVARWYRGTVDRSFGYVTAQIYGVTVGH